MVPDAAEAARATSSRGSKASSKFGDALGQSTAEPHFSQDRSVDLPAVRQHYLNLCLSEEATEVLMGSWAADTKRQYQKPIDSWFVFCGRNNFNALNASPHYFIEFLMSYYRKGLGYSSINNVRSALSSIVVTPTGIPIGKDPLVCRFMKGVFKARPSLPRYVYTLDINMLFNYMRGLPPLTELSLKQLTLCLTILLCLLSGSRCQTIHLFDLQHCHKTSDSFTFAVHSIIKQTRPGTHQQPIVYHKYPHDSKLCVFGHLQEYINQTREKRGEYTQLLISYIQPHKPVTRDSVARWCSTIMQKAGIDTSIFAPHSTRSASTSAAFREGCPLQTILDAGGWSKEETFSRFYHKPVRQTLQANVLSENI